MEHMGPVRVPERIAVVDILRGFALLGILLVNMTYFSEPLATSLSGVSGWTGTLDRAIRMLTIFFAEGKFIALFAFLFGLGFTFQLGRDRAGAAGRLRRRLVVLLCFGLAHSLLLWAGDVLVLYAVLGFALVWLCESPLRSVRNWAVVCLFVPIVLAALYVGSLQASHRSAGLTQELQQQFAESGRRLEQMGREASVNYSRGSFAVIFAQRVADLGIGYAGLLVSGGVFQVFALLLLGMYAGRLELFQRVAEYLPVIRRVRWGLLFVGLVGSGLYTFMTSPYAEAIPAWMTVLQATGAVLGGPALGLAYGSGLVLLAQDPVWLRRLGPLAAAGRMALTNYLMQSLVCTTIFYSYGLGLFGKVSPTVGLVLTFGIYGVELLWSGWWLRRFQFGPAEWVWRSLTYGRRQPMRLVLGK